MLTCCKCWLPSQPIKIAHDFLEQVAFPLKSVVCVKSWNAWAAAETGNRLMKTAGERRSTPAAGPGVVWTEHTTDRWRRTPPRVTPHQAGLQTGSRSGLKAPKRSQTTRLLPHSFIHLCLQPLIILCSWNWYEGESPKPMWQLCQFQTFLLIALQGGKSWLQLYRATVTLWEDLSSYNRKVVPLIPVSSYQVVYCIMIFIALWYVSSNQSLVVFVSLHRQFRQHIHWKSRQSQ